MANRSQLEMANISQRERESKRNARTQRRGQNIKGATDFVSNAVKLAALANDPKWYKKWIDDLDKVTNVPTFTALGEYLEKPYATTAYSLTSRGNNSSLPGICVFKYVPSIGRPARSKLAADLLDSIGNKSATMFLTQLRKLNSRVGEYAPAEVILALNAWTDLAADIETIKFVIGAVQTLGTSNDYLGRSLVEAKGFDYQDAFDNIAVYKDNLANLIKEYNEYIPMPKELTLLDRRRWMSSVIIKDGESEQSQMYMFRKTGSYVFDDLANKLLYQDVCPNRLLSELITHVQLQMNAWQNTTTMVTLKSDFRAGITPDKFLKIEDIPMDYKLEIVVHEEVLSQIQNMDILPAIVVNGNNNILPATIDKTSVGIYVDTTTGIAVQGNSLYQYPGIHFQHYNNNVAYVMASDYRNKIAAVRNTSPNALQRDFTYDKRMNWHKKPSEVTGDDVLVATRLKNSYTQTVNPVGDTSDTSTWFIVEDQGTEVIESAELFVRYFSESQSDAVGNSRGLYFSTQIVVIANTSAIYVTVLPLIGFANAFHGMPLSAILNCPSTSQAYITTVGEIENVSYVEQSNLKRINKQCVQSEYFIDGGEFVRV